MKNNKFTLIILLVVLITSSTCKKLDKSMLVSTGDVTNILTNSADVSGLVIDLGAGATEHGHCYATTPNVTIAGTKTLLGVPPAGGFTSQLVNLEAGTKYYVKAYLSNNKETVYGKEINFTTVAASLSTITTTEITNITQTTATSGGNITNDGGAAVTARGVCWNTATVPTIANNKTSDGTGSGSFVSSLTSLSPGKTYYIRAYATNSEGTAYGTEIVFTTTAAIPTVITTAASTITPTTVSTGGEVTNDNGATVTARGVCWNTSANPTISLSTKTIDGTGTGSFTSNITGLTANTTYYVRAYATNSVGTAYGTQVSFTTNAVTTQVQWVLDAEISTGAKSSGIAITPDNSKIIVTNNTTPGTIKVISTSNYTISSISYPAEGYPNGVAVTPDGLTAVVNTMHQTIYIDLSTNSVSGNFVAPCVGTTLYGIAINSNNAIYPDLSSGCTQQGLRSINVTPPTTLSSFIQISTSGVLFGIAITGSSAIVTAYNAAPVNVNLSTSGVQKISGMTSSYGVAILHNGNEALIEGDSLNRVSLTNNKVTKAISDIYSTTFQSIAITADDKYAFVVGSFKIIVVSLTDNTVIQTFSTGGTSVATTSDGLKFFVTNSYNGTVSVYKKVIPGGK